MIHKRSLTGLFFLFRCFFVLQALDIRCEKINVAGDENELIIQTSEKTHDGSQNPDLTMVSIKWQRSINTTENLKKFKEVFEHYNVSGARLYVETAEKEESYELDQEIVHFQGSFHWKVPRIPCFEYEYQVVIPPYSYENITECFGTYLAKLPPSTPFEMKNANYSPKPPPDLAVAPGKNSATLIWNTTTCSEENVILIYENDADLILRHNISLEASSDQNNQNEIIQNLKSCTKYRADVYSKIKGMTIDHHEYASANFYTDPSLDVLDYIKDLNVSAGLNSIVLNFQMNQEHLTCLDNYFLSTCDKNYSCSNPISFQKNHSENFDCVNYKSNDRLKQCSKYYIKIESHHPEYSLHPRYVPMITKVDETGKNFTIKSTPGENFIEIFLTNVECIESVFISYQSIGENSNPLLEHHVLNNNSILIKDLYSNHLYQINITGIVSGSMKDGNITMFQLLNIMTGK